MSTFGTNEDYNNYVRLAQLEVAMRQSSDPTYVKEIIRKLSNVNYKIPTFPRLRNSLDNRNFHLSGCTALHLAYRCCSSKEDIGKVAVLLNNGADVAIKSDKGSTVLHETFHTEHRRKFKLKQKLRNPYVTSTLSAQVASGNSLNPRDNVGLSHLHIACMTNHKEAVEFFLANGESVDQRVNSNVRVAGRWGPLHFAVRSKAVDVVDVLLSRGASLQLKDADGLTPLHWCLRQILKNANVAQLNYLYRKEHVERLNYLEGDKKTMKLLLNSCINSDYSMVDDFGLSTFHLACALGDTDIVESHSKQVDDLDAAVKSDAPIFPGYTALHFAALTSAETLIHLINKGADITAEDASGSSPFDICLKKYSIEDVCSILKARVEWREILLSDGATKLIDLVYFMGDCNRFKDYSKSANVRDLTVPKSSPFWPGSTILHIAVTITQSVWRKRNLDDDKPLIKCDLRSTVGDSSSDDSDDDMNEDEQEATKDHLEIVKECLRLGVDVTAQDARGSTPLHLAFHSQKVEIVELLLQHHSSYANPVDEHNLSHLHIACAANNATLAERLISKGADIEAQASKTIKWFKLHSSRTRYFPFMVVAGSTALHVAVASRSESIVKVLLARGADPCAIDVNGVTPIHRCMTDPSEGRPIGKLLMSSPLLRDRLASGIGLSHLHVACHLSDADAVARLLDQGADFDARILHCRRVEALPFRQYQDRDVYGDLSLGTPYAFLRRRLRHGPIQFASWNDGEIVRLLVQRGLDLTTEPPLHHLFEYRDDAFKEFVLPILRENRELQNRLRRESGMTMLHVGCRLRDVELMRKCLDAGEDVNAKIHEDSSMYPGFTALRVLMDAHGNPDDVRSAIFRLLLDGGADATVSDADNETFIHRLYFNIYLFNYTDYLPWMSAVFERFHDFSKNPINARGMSILHVACIRKDEFAVAKFLKHGANPNQSIHHLESDDFAGGQSPLHAIVRDDWDETTFNIIDLLVESGANVNAEDRRGNTPLHLVAMLYRRNDVRKDRKAFFEKLVNVGADVNAMNIWSETPLELLLKSGIASHSEINFFLKSGCNINSYNPISQQGYISHIFTHNLEHCDVRKSLYEAYLNGPIVNEFDDMGRSFLHNLISNTYIATVRDDTYVDFLNLMENLVAAGCDIDHRDEQGKTALHLAVQFENYEAVRALLSAGADINVLDDNGQTAYVSSMESYTGILKGERRSLWKYCGIRLPTLFALHMRKLQLAGLFICEQNRQIHNDVLSKSAIKMNEIEEIFEEAKYLKVGLSSITIWDVVSETGMVAAYPTMLPEDREFFDDFCKNVNRNPLLERFNEIECLIKLQYRQALKRPSLVHPAKVNLMKLLQFPLPELCCLAVIKFLTNEELKNLIAILNHKQ